MTGRSVEMKLLPSLKTVKRGVQGFILFSVLGVALSLWWRRPADLGLLLGRVQWEWALMLIPLILLDYVLGGLRYRLFFDGRMFPRVSLWNCMRSNWANIFLGAATPFQTGGGAAQLYILWRCGARVSDSMLVSMVNFVTTLFFFLVSTMGAMMWLPSGLLGEHLTPLLRTGFAVVGGIAASVLLALIFPSIVLTIVGGALRRIPLRNPGRLAFRDRLSDALGAGIRRFREAFVWILRRGKRSMVLTVLVTIVLFFNKYLMGYAIARALAQQVPFAVFLGLEIMQMFLIYFAPTPGASGVAELSSVWLMGKLMPHSVLLFYAVLWRFATTVLGAVIGGIVLLLDLRSQTRDAPPEPAAARPAG
jgi:glycosyltransferase 2 family protein